MIRNAYLSLAASGAARTARRARPRPRRRSIRRRPTARTAPSDEASISEETFADLAQREEFVLSVTEKGYGVRSSAYDYRITGRGGQGIDNMDLTRPQRRRSSRSSRSGITTRSCWSPMAGW